MGERKSGALVRLLAQVKLLRRVSPCWKRRRTSTQPASYQLRAVSSSKLIADTGNVSLTIVTPGGKVVPGRKRMVLKGRRGLIGPGPGDALLIRCERCKW